MWSWMFIGILFGSLVTSTHPTQEECVGRKLLLERAGVTRGMCLQRPPSLNADPNDDDR